MLSLLTEMCTTDLKIIIRPLKCHKDSKTERPVCLFKLYGVQGCVISGAFPRHCTVTASLLQMSLQVGAVFITTQQTQDGLMEIISSCVKMTPLFLILLFCCLQLIWFLGYQIQASYNADSSSGIQLECCLLFTGFTRPPVLSSVIWWLH